MKKKKKHFKGKQSIQANSLPFKKENYLLFVFGLVVIILGFVALAQPPWDSFSSLTLAPILLVVGYCVIIPVAILYKKRLRTVQQDDDVASEPSLNE